MEEDIYTEVTEQSWFGRIKDAIVGIFIGLILIVVSMGVLFWNEGRAVKRYKALKEGSSAVISVASDSVLPENEAKLVHVTGLATTEESLSDPDFPISVNALRLKRNVEMYQWDEYTKTRKEKKVGGGETKITEYHYKKVWSTTVIRSSGFKKRSGHENPTTMPFSSLTKSAENVTLGAFFLSQNQVNDIDVFEAVLTGDSNELPYTGGREIQPHGNGYYIGRSPGTPHIGDVRVEFSQVKPTTISIVARQKGAMFEPYMTANGSLQLLEVGVVSASEMFKQAQSRNTLLTWILRAAGLIAMFIGFSMLFKPLSVIGDVIPFIGNMIEFGTGIISFILALSISITVIAVAWLFYRPLLGGGLLAASAGMYFFVFRAGRGKKGAVSMPDPVQKQRAMAGDDKVQTEEGAFGTQEETQTSADPFDTEPTSEDPFLTASDTSSMSDRVESISEEELMDMGKETFAKGDFKGAIAAYSEVIKMDINNATAYYNRGVAYSKLKNREAFINDFKRAAKNGHERAAEYLKSKNIS